MTPVDDVMDKTMKLLLAGLIVLIGACSDQGRPPPPIRAENPAAGAAEIRRDLIRATYSPLHFKPAIDAATDEQCLACHQEILSEKVRPASPAGVAAETSLAWYQQMTTYTGDQETFHRRHLVTPLAKNLMNLKCSTCHQGHDPREEAQGSSATAPSQADASFTLRKQVNPETICLKCHGQMVPEDVMGLTGPWHEVKDLFLNDCLPCHASTRTTRHQVDYLNASAIEAAAIAGKKDHSGGDVCYGCHGGRAWYRIAYPYIRTPWPEMPEGTPDWAKTRPAPAEPRLPMDKPRT